MRAVIGKTSAGFAAGSLVGVLGLAAFGACVPGPAAAATSPAATVPAATVPASPVGLYDAMVSGYTFTLSLGHQGNFDFHGGPKGTWSESGSTITMDSLYGKVHYVLTIAQRGGNLGSKRHPGSIVANGTVVGTWYATAAAGQPR